MKKGFYRTLAWSGIRNNKRLYLPYMFTCGGMVMMCYLVSYLSNTPVFAQMRGGDTMQSFLGFGFGVMSIFSLIFLFYTNSFLIRRRKKEFGLYNILGLGKRNLALVLAVETLLIAVVTLTGGLFCGILFSKLAELAMVRLLDGSVTFAFSIQPSSVAVTAILFVGIHFLIFLNTLRQVHLTNPVELLRSESAGEKPPKGNWIAAFLGLLLLGGAYYMAVTIQDPITALVTFFLAVVMVILATYLLFISGSVKLCRVLQKNKRYYYKTNHFVSVSSMVYRMKRNGAGLASICILSTMVLVMLSSTTCLYVGQEDALRTRYPRDFNFDTAASDTQMLTGPGVEETRDFLLETVQAYGVSPENVLDYRVAGFAALLENGTFSYDRDMVNDSTLGSLSKVWQVYLVPLEDYNRMMGKNETLEPGEALVYTTKTAGDFGNTLRLGDGVTLTIRKQVDSFEDNGVDAMQIIPSLYLFVEDFQQTVTAVMAQEPGDGGQSDVAVHWYYGFDLPCGEEEQKEIFSVLRNSDVLKEISISYSGEGYFHTSIESAAMERADFYGLTGGFLFLGVFLGIIFLIAAVLIIYYKQVSEGYEDQSRFAIMQKVGMTKKEIKKSINSQILTVFFLPLLTAGVHLSFAFPLIRKLLLIFNLRNFSLLVATTVGCYLLFSLFYILVYRITSQTYFSLVSGMREETA